MDLPKFLSPWTYDTIGHWIIGIQRITANVQILTNNNVSQTDRGKARNARVKFIYCIKECVLLKHVLR